MNENDMWDWQSRDYSLEDTTPIEISECLLNGANKNDNHHLYPFDDETTPLKACGDLAYTAPCGEFTGKETEEYLEPSSQVKRRRMLQFEPEIFDASLFNDDAFLRSQETEDSLEDAISEMSQWVAGFAEEESGMNNECLDPVSEGWIANCFSDVDLHFNNEDISSTSGASDFQVDVPECKTTESEANLVKKQPVKTRRNVVFKGRKSYMSTPPKLASSIVKPFAFIKPFGADGDVTLKDINKRIHSPLKPKQTEDSSTYPMSAFSGKPVVGKTKIHTEGGKGSITIMRTKGNIGLALVYHDIITLFGGRMDRYLVVWENGSILSGSQKLGVDAS